MTESAELVYKTLIKLYLYSTKNSEIEYVHLESPSLLCDVYPSPLVNSHGRLTAAESHKVVHLSATKDWHLVPCMTPRGSEETSANHMGLRLLDGSQQHIVA